MTRMSHQENCGNCHQAYCVCKAAPPSPPVAPDLDAAFICLKCGAGPAEPCDRGVDHSVAPELAQENSSPASTPATPWLTHTPPECRSPKPESAQENQAKRAEFEALAEKVGAPDVTVLASSGEAAGDGVTHEGAREAVGRMRLVETADHLAAESVRRYIDQQEANGNALRYWSTRARELEQSLQTERAYKNGAKAKQEQAEREAAELKESNRQLVELLSDEARTLRGHLEDTEEERDFLRGDRDAERAQKEALRVELEQSRELHGGAIVEREKLRAERDELRRKLILFSSRASSLLNHLSNEPDSDGAKDAWARLQSLIEGEFPDPPPELGPQEATFEPAPAAPVAKEEATAEAWVPNVGDTVTSWRTPKLGRGVVIAIPSQTLANSVDNCDVEFEGGMVREVWLSSLVQAPAEPAPQPPAKEEVTAEQKDPDPRLWFVVEGADGSYSACQTETEARELLKCASEWSFITRTLPVPKSRQKPAPQPPGEDLLHQAIDERDPIEKVSLVIRYLMEQRRKP